jgi:hypothetical protein
MAVDIHFPGNGSLKDKRQSLRGLKDILIRRFGASVAEVGYHDLWQRSRLVISLSSSSSSELEQALGRMTAFIEGRDLRLSSLESEIIKVEGS